MPNPVRLVANSPAALEGYLGLSGAVAKGSLPARTRERIALAVAQFNDRVSDADVQAVRMAGYDDAQIVEKVQHVAPNTWTNYVTRWPRPTSTSLSPRRSPPETACRYHVGGAA